MWRFELVSGTFVSILVITALSGAALMFCPVPWSAALLAVAAFSALAAWRARANVATLVFANLAAILFALAAFEAYLGLQRAKDDGVRMEGTLTEGFTHADDVLGYAPDAGRQVTSRKRYRDQVLYDVVYTIGPDGLRITPPATGVTDQGCLVFLGDSVTFGEGVNDHESFPYLVGRQLGGRYSVHNFAYSGYGPHQMLATLQAGRIEKTVRCRPSHFIYLGILEHIPRVAGLADWDAHGPRFRLGANGSPVRDGNFDTPSAFHKKAWFEAWIDVPLRQYLTWQRFFGGDREPDAADLELYIEVVLAAARTARERFPGSVFHMILWDGRDDPRLEIIEKRAQAGGIGVHRLTTVIPDFAAQSQHRLLIPQDGHPNRKMHRLIASYITDNLSGHSD